MIKLSVVIPVLDESLLIKELIERVVSNVEKITQNYEVLIVDDGSKDSTWQKIESEAKNEKRIKGIRLSRNFGHHYAISAGIHRADGEWVVVMDGDLQDRPEVIPELYSKAQEGFDIVFVSRQNRPEKIYYKVAQKLFYWMLKVLSGIDLDSRQANFSIINSKVVEAFRSFPEYARFYGSTIKWLGFQRTQIFADHGKRFSGQTSYTLKKRIKLALDIIVAFSDRPLKFAIGFGILISMMSILLAIWIAFSSIYYGYEVTGWASIICISLFSTGVLLVLFGIFGIYLGRIFDQVKQRPLYIISKEIN
jgi:glycosyltransferase involved in cell wall biosynthesis